MRKSDPWSFFLRLLRDPLPWFSYIKERVTQTGGKLTFLFPRHHHPTLVELHGVRCDAHSWAVAATGGVLFPATGAPEEDRSGGQRALDTPWKRGGERCSAPASHPPTQAKRWHLRIDQRQRVSYPLHPFLWAEATEQTGCSASTVAHRTHVSGVAPEHSLASKRVKRGVVGSN